MKKDTALIIDGPHNGEVELQWHGHHTFKLKIPEGQEDVDGSMCRFSYTKTQFVEHGVAEMPEDAKFIEFCWPTAKELRQW